MGRDLALARAKQLVAWRRDELVTFWMSTGQRVPLDQLLERFTAIYAFDLKRRNRQVERLYEELARARAPPPTRSWPWLRGWPSPPLAGTSMASAGL
jgi:hypothetical protein